MRRLIGLLLTINVLLSLGSAAVMAQQVHVVQRGENLWNIAVQYGRTIQEVGQANGIAPPYVIHAGNRIRIPASGASPAQAQSQTQSQPGVQTELWTPTDPLYDRPDDTDNCCDLDRECHTEEEWKAGWLAFERLECWDAYFNWKRTPDPAYMPPAGSTNCCDAPGWLCLNDDHIRAGEDAFVAYSHCNPNIKAAYLPTLVYHDATDNCCRLGRDCQTNADWERGYSDFLHFRCEFYVPLVQSLPVHLVGSEKFQASHLTAFSLLKARSPYYYDYAVRGIGKIVSAPIEAWGEAHCGPERLMLSSVPDDLRAHFWTTIVGLASLVVHEACHCHQEMAGFVPPGQQVVENGVNVGIELPCNEQQHLVIRQIDPTDTTKFAIGYSAQIVGIVQDYPWLESVLEKPLTYHRHFITYGP